MDSGIRFADSKISNASEVIGCISSLYSVSEIKDAFNLSSLRLSVESTCRRRRSLMRPRRPSFAQSLLACDALEEAMAYRRLPLAVKADIRY